MSRSHTGVPDVSASTLQSTASRVGRTTMPRLRSLDAIRGLAAVLVVLYHARFICLQTFRYDVLHGAMALGYASVDVFFVLSGFVIFLLHSRDLGRPDRLRSF